MGEWHLEADVSSAEDAVDVRVVQDDGGYGHPLDHRDRVGSERGPSGRHRASLRIHLGAQALTCPVVAPVRPGGLTICLIARCASVAIPVWHPYSERHSGTMGAPLRPERRRRAVPDERLAHA